ncbi:hypothetical protein OIU85_004446 [Salix viminalis]|uniref:Lon N-terminal domain-containing protein n=1 Tax=Salix viminalis TaxID=40686 RepID=A0A9Q0PSJ8_SALVM|nr:hypothetical protein OIU85_004446 [Salix viminalis]
MVLFQEPEFRNSLSLSSRSFHFQVNVNGNHQPFIRRRISKRCRVSPNAASSLELPLLPFNMNEVLVPTESKTLHLYEARYLALLEESLLRKKLFVHFVLDPILISNSGTEASFAARYGCLVNIENIKRLEVGALVSVRGIGRVKLINFVQSEPYLKGEVIPMQDMVIGSGNEISSKVIAVKDALRSLNSLEIKLKAPKEELLQTCVANSLTWAEKEPSLECDQSFIPSLAERVSFAAFQPITRSTQSETLKLQQQKLRAMDLKDTLQRLDNSLDSVNENISMVAAKACYSIIRDAVSIVKDRRAADMGFASTASFPFSITITATTTMTSRKPRLLHHHDRHSSRLHCLSKCSLLPRKCRLNLRRSRRGNAACRVPCSLLKVEEDLDDEACELVRGSGVSIGEGDDRINAYLLKAVKNNNGIGILLLSDIFGFEDSSTRDFAYRVACNGYNVLVPDLFRGDPWTKDRPRAMLEQWITKTGTTEGQKRHRCINKMDGRRVFSRRNIKEARRNWILLRRGASDRCAIQRSGSLFWRRSIFLWHEDGPCFSLRH